MARPRQPIDVQHQAEQVLEQERTERTAWKLQRLQAIRLAMEGQETYRRIAEIVRTTSGSLGQWIGWFRQGGTEELLGHANGAKGGKAPRFDPQQWERFRVEVAKGTWRTARDAPRTSVRVWGCDEARFGWHTEHRRMWGCAECGLSSPTSKSRSGITPREPWR